MYRHRRDIANYGKRSMVCTCTANWDMFANDCSTFTVPATVEKECFDCAKPLANCTCDADYDAWKASELDRWDWN